MKNHALMCIGIAGLVLSLLFVGILYQSSALMNAAYDLKYELWEEAGGYFVNGTAKALGIICVFISLGCCVASIVNIKKKN